MIAHGLGRVAQLRLHAAERGVPFLLGILNPPGRLHQDVSRVVQVANADIHDPKEVIEAVTEAVGRRALVRGVVRPVMRGSHEIGDA